MTEADLVDGFQWIDGSFLERIEQIEDRDPHDIDVTTFFHLPNGQTQESLLTHAPWLANHRDTQDLYGVHAYYVQLDVEKSESIIEQATYWYSLWSHRRDGRWKGYVQIDLSPADDPTARANLDAMGLPQQE